MGNRIFTPETFSELERRAAERAKSKISPHIDILQTLGGVIDKTDDEGCLVTLEDMHGISRQIFVKKEDMGRHNSEYDANQGVFAVRYSLNGSKYTAVITLNELKDEKPSVMMPKIDYSQFKD